MCVGRTGGATVDWQALESALRSDPPRLAACLSDVASEEPLPAGHPLWHVPGLVLTPHNSGAEEETGLLSYVSAQLPCVCPEPVLAKRRVFYRKTKLYKVGRRQGTRTAWVERSGSGGNLAGCITSELCRTSAHSCGGTCVESLSSTSSTTLMVTDGCS